MVHPPQPHLNPLVFASRSSRSWPLSLGNRQLAIDNELVTPLRQRRAAQKLGLLRAPLPSLPDRERRTAPRFRGRAAGASGTGSSDNGNIMSWSDKRAAGDMGQGSCGPRLVRPAAGSYRWPMPPSSRYAPAHNGDVIGAPPPRPRPRPSPVPRSGLGRAAVTQLVHSSPRRRCAQVAAARRNFVAVDFKQRFTNWKPGP